MSYGVGHWLQLGSELPLATYTTAYGNARSLTYGARPGIEPTTSWFLVRFINHCATTGTPRGAFSCLCFLLNLTILFQDLLHPAAAKEEEDREPGGRESGKLLRKHEPGGLPIQGQGFSSRASRQAMPSVLAVCGVGVAMVFQRENVPRRRPPPKQGPGGGLTSVAPGTRVCAVAGQTTSLSRCLLSRNTCQTCSSPVPENQEENHTKWNGNPQDRDEAVISWRGVSESSRFYPRMGHFYKSKATTCTIYRPVLLCSVSSSL